MYPRSSRGAGVAEMECACSDGAHGGCPISHSLLSQTATRMDTDQAALEAGADGGGALSRAPTATAPLDRRDHTRSHEITRDHTRSPEITRDHPRLPEITRDHPRSPEITRDHPRSPEITREHPRSPRDQTRIPRSDSTCLPSGTGAPRACRLRTASTCPRRASPVCSPSN